jgi:two-component system, NtrC family, sensor kinase
MKGYVPSVARIWVIAAVVIAGVLAVAFVSRYVIVGNTAEAFNRQQLFLVRESARGIENFIQGIQISLNTAADTYGLYPDSKTLAPFFLRQQQRMRALFLIAQDGAIIHMHPPQFTANFDQANLQKLLAQAAAAKQQVFISDFIDAPHGNGGRSFIMGVPVRGTRQWMCCLVNVSALKDEFIYPIKSGKTGYAWMIDNRGVLLAHPNKVMEGKKVAELLKELWPENTSFNLETLIDREMVKGVEGKGEYTGWHIGEKQLTKKLIAYAPIKFNGLLWSIGVAAPYREAMAPLMESLIGPMIFMCGFLAVLVVGAFFLSAQEMRKRIAAQEIAWSHEVIDVITDGISIIDRDYRVLMVNKAISQWHNKPMGMFRGKPCYEVFQQQSSLCQGCPAHEAFETGRPVFRERVSTTLGGKKFYFHLTAFPLKDEDGRTMRVVEYVKDVTGEMALRSELLQHERKAMIVKMSAQVAHEIRNPLGSLTLNIDLLDDAISGYKAPEAVEAKELIITIKNEIESLHKVLREYLECTRFPTIKPAKHDVNMVIEDLFALLEEELRHCKILFKTTFEYNLPAAALDKDHIHRAFLNLVRNAIEAMPAGGTIEVTTRLNQPWIEVVFADSGSGMPADQLERIFTPFYTTKSGGTGLGLSITQHIIAEHKGEIICDSAPGQGARFTVRLPVWQDGPDEFIAETV